MAKYDANSANAVESGGNSSFRIAKDGERVRVVFLYSDPSSIDGWACHRFSKPNGFTYVVDCPRSPKDPIDKCPACKAQHQLYTRIFVRILNLNTNEVTIWDRASSFRRDLVGMMEYFNPLYSRVYEITRRGSGFQTQYQFQSLGESGITPEKYEELVKEADKVAEQYVRPIDSLEMVLSSWNAAKEAESKNEVQVDNSAPQGAWGQPPQGAWGQPPQQTQQSWGQPQQQAPQQQAPQQSWGQPPQQAAPNASSVSNPAPQPQAPQSWGQPPQNWGQPPQSWGQNTGNQS